jgi:hypothetical protein
MNNMIITNNEWPVSLHGIWGDKIGNNCQDMKITIFGDVIYQDDSSVKIIQMTWFNVLEICTVMDEVDWILESPINRGGDWIYPQILYNLMPRQHGMVYHFIKPLGFGGKCEIDNIEQMHCVASSRGAIDADPAPGAIAPRVEETGVGHGPG